MATKKKATPKKKPATKKAPAKQASSKATDARYWKLIEASRRGADPEELVDNLTERLQKLSVQEILGFDLFFSERLREAYRNDLWAVAYIMNGGCSDDGFDYFLGWLIGKGQKHFEAALKNPEHAAKGVAEGDDPYENEEIWYAASNAYEEKTGLDDFNDKVKVVNRKLIGKAFDEDTVDELYPKLAERFG